MSDRQRDRYRPSARERDRLLAVIQASGAPHAVDPGTLGEYAELRAWHGPVAAATALPDVAAHLAGGCVECAADLADLAALLAQPDEPAPGGPDAPGGRDGEPAGPARPEDTAVRPADLRAALGPSGEHSQVVARPPEPPRPPSPARPVAPGQPSAPDPRRAEEQGRRQRVRRLREILLVVAAAAILLMGLSLIGMAYFAAGAREPARLILTPQPPAPPGQVPGQAPGQAPAQPPAGRAAPSGMTCPPSHPIKGNRESMIYHPPEGAFYGQTRPEVCFATPADAEADGYRRSQR